MIKKLGPGPDRKGNKSALCVTDGNPDAGDKGDLIDKDLKRRRKIIFQGLKQKGQGFALLRRDK